MYKRQPQYNLYNAPHIDGARKTQKNKKSNFHKETELQSEVEIKVTPALLQENTLALLLEKDGKWVFLTATFHNPIK